MLPTTLSSVCLLAYPLPVKNFGLCRECLVSVARLCSPFIFHRSAWEFISVRVLADFLPVKNFGFRQFISGVWCGQILIATKVIEFLLFSPGWKNQETTHTLVPTQSL